MTLKEAISILKNAGVDSAEHDGRELFSHFGGFDRNMLYLGDAESESEELISAIERRAKHEPLQYIIGFADFYRENYILSPDCLIPRSDTEILVDYAVKNLPHGAKFADLCTGSGCIAISVLKNTKNTTAIAVDINSGALAIAKENARRNGVSERLCLHRLDLMSETVEERFFAVLSNPPYVSDTAYESLDDEIFHEPKEAFVGGFDGGDFYRRFTPIYKTKIADGGFIAYEIGYDQADLLREIADKNGMTLQIIKDLSGNDRVAVLKNK